MYEIDSKDKVQELKDFPQSSVGAPIPVVLASELNVAVAYYLNDIPKGWDGSNIKMVDATNSDEPLAIVVFDLCSAHYFGPPNDEAFSGHPLANRGLEPYGNFEIINSSWIRKLEKMNSVHPYHDKKRFVENKRHYILTFHDSIFECIAQKLTIHLGRGSIKEMIPKMSELVL
ncbi:hypothetical protein [Aureibaculum luteum]|uniref:hypothetical protein n=1 Tax=Aureibaculum luteum TaxID=1548456 RepID=UPI0018E50C59|nr:hypothetical protein [Aureibaculum luteum]